MIPQPALRLLLSVAAALTIPVAPGAATRNTDMTSSRPPVVAVPRPAAVTPSVMHRDGGLLRPILEQTPAARTEESRARALRPDVRAVAHGALAASPRPQGSATVSILYAPAEVDDPAYRAAIAAITGGPVDYFDANAGTPLPGTLASYTCVYTWVNSGYADKTLFGDRLADYVDAGGKVILGPYCTYTTGAPLGGRIMTAAYSPVTSPLGDNHHVGSPYVGDGTRSAHAGVLAYDCGDRDVLALQGSGIVNGHYTDGEIAQAYRPDGRVIYSNGAGSAENSSPSGDWPKVVANLAMAHPASPGVLSAVPEDDDPGFRASVASFTTGVVDYFDVRPVTPSAALLNTYDCIHVFSDFPPADPTLFGDRLADRVDAGGRVVLGPFVTFTQIPVNVAGRIMTPDYCPIASPSGSNHYTVSTPSFDGVTGLFTGVAALSTPFRDLLTGQGNGIVDGHYLDGEILASYRPDGRVIHINGTGFYGLGTGDWARLWANSVTATFPAGKRTLFALGSGDFPTIRADVAAQTGGVVDYFDATVATPTVAQMLNYDCVYTLLNNGYADNVLFGNRLADYVDAGGKVILGIFSTYTQGPVGVAGRIRTPAYSPVTSLNGDNHYLNSTYFHDGATSMHRNILNYETQFRDSLTLQGSGRRDGSYADGEIAVAYRPDRRVAYVNGIGFPLGAGDWARLMANVIESRVTSGILYGCNDAAQMFTLNTLTGAGSFAYNLPTAGTSGATEIVSKPSTGEAWVQSRDFTNGIQKFDPGTGVPVNVLVPDGASFNGLEFALGKLYGTTSTTVCGGSSLKTLDPATGASTTIGSTGLGPLSGLAFDARGSVLYGITSLCNTAQLMRFDITSGSVAAIATLPSTYSSLEFGPDGDLYAGGDFLDGGALYRVGMNYGAVQTLGTPGYGGITGLMLSPPGTVDAQEPPTRLAFSTPFPNPSVSGLLQFRFSLPTAGDARLELYDVAGRLRWRKAMPGMGAGDHVVSWDGRASSGERLGAGVYQMRLVSPVGSRAVRVVRLD